MRTILKRTFFNRQREHLLCRSRPGAIGRLANVNALVHTLYVGEHQRVSLRPGAVSPQAAYCFLGQRHKVPGRLAETLFAPLQYWFGYARGLACENDVLVGGNSVPAKFSSRWRFHAAGVGAVSGWLLT